MSPTDMLTRSEEKALVNALTPDIAVPILLSVIVLPALSIGIAVAALMGMFPMWLATLPIGFLAYAQYLFVHESIHGNIIRASYGRRFHIIAGWIGSLALGSTYPVLQRTHLGHHRHVNSNDDPDIYVRGSFGELIVTWIAMSFLDLLPLAVSSRFVGYYRRVHSLLDKNERRQVAIAQTVQILVMLTLIATGRGAVWMLLIYLPQCVGAFILHVFLQWAPHAPFHVRQRYRSSRIIRWPARGPLVVIENTHIFHHLWPQVPFHNLGKLSAALKPTLAARGIVPEGMFAHTDLQCEGGSGPLAMLCNFGAPNRNGTATIPENMAQGRTAVIIGSGANQLRTAAPVALAESRG